MPQSTQIIPEYTQPHVTTVINDNTSIPDDGVQIVEYTGVNTLILTTADQGRDNQLVDSRALGQLIEEFGYPNMKLHGQPLYNAVHYLSQTQYERRAFIMRVLPDDATYANAIIVAKVKPTAKVGVTPGSLSVKIETYQIADYSTEADLVAEMTALRSDVPDASGYLSFPLFALVSRGRGKYGNNVRVRMTKDVMSDKENIYTNYNVQVYVINSGLNIKATVSGSLYEGALEGTKTICIEDKIDASDDSKQKINFKIDQDSLEELHDLYLATVAPDAPVDLDEFDFIYGLKRNSSEKITGYNIEAPAEGVQTLDGVEGVALTGGSDGILDPKVLADKVAAGKETRNREDIINELFINALSGTTDRRINSRKRIPLDFVCDANYAEDVKNALSILCLKRGDFSTFLDSGIFATLSDANEWVNTYTPEYQNRLITREFQNYKIRDPYTGKKITVTTPYYLIGRLVSSYATPDNMSEVIAGPARALITDHVPYSMTPSIDDDELDIKQVFYDKKLNYYVTQGENIYCRGTQSTTQEKDTDLSEENNVRILMDIKSVLEGFSSNIIYSNTQPDDIVTINKQVKEYIQRYYPGHVVSFDVYFTANEWEQKRNILHCYAAVVFKGLAKRIIIEIDVNPREVIA